MAKSLIILFLCITSVLSDAEMKVEMAKEESMAEKTNEAPVDAESSIKQKRDSWPVHSTPCPPHWPHNDWHMPEHHHKVQFIHQPTVTVVKPHQSGWNPHNPWQGWDKPSHGWPMSGWQNPGWQSPAWKLPSHGWQSPGWKQPSHGWPSSGWKQPSYGWPSSGWKQPSYGWPSSGWKQPSHGWPSSGWKNPGWQSPGWQPQGWQKPYAPSYSHQPSYHHVKPAVIVKPDCPDEHHQHHIPHHTGIVYAPQHSYHQPQPHYVKVAKPVYHHPQPVYHHPQPVYHHPQPVYHHPQPIYHQPVYQHPVDHHVPKVEICD